jgi:GNAT superfamily N-acetyltransferase
MASARVRSLFPRGAPQVWAGFDRLAGHHPNDPHWYLAFVGIEPGIQRRGLGRRLLEPVLQHADREARLCYLETPFPDTRNFYRRLGFDDSAELHPVTGAPTIWTMTREPNVDAGLYRSSR